MTRSKLPTVIDSTCNDSTTSRAIQLFPAYLFLFCLLVAGNLFAQSGNFSNNRFVSLPNTTGDRIAVADVLQSGEALEKKGLWGDALTLYERAQKEHGQSKEIRQKLFNARTHYDVKRRYSDPGFIQTVRTTPLSSGPEYPVRGTWKDRIALRQQTGMGDACSTGTGQRRRGTF